MNTVLSAISSGLAVVVAGYQTTSSRGRWFWASGSVAVLNPTGLSAAKAGVERQSRNRAREAVFIVVIFLEFGGASLPKILSAADKLAKSTNQTFMSISPLVPLMRIFLECIASGKFSGPEL